VGWAFCKILPSNRTKMFHVKHFGTITLDQKDLRKA
jgi:hypothetical protein